MRDSRTFLREAAQIYDRSRGLDASAKSIVWRKGFSSGADWMRLAMEDLRCQRLPEVNASFTCLGLAKYALSSLAALLALGCAVFIHPALALLAIPAFYAVEVQWVFLFPAALDGSAHPWTDSRQLMRRHAGTLAAMSIVLPFAWRMLSGGFFGQGFMRSWCIGCLAVVLWYEECRNAPLTTPCVELIPRLDCGQRAPLFIRQETIVLSTSEITRLLLITDIHTHPRNSERLLATIDAAITSTLPHLIILGGDLADSKRGLTHLEPHLRTWTQMAPVLAIPGNHDLWLGRDHVRKAVLHAGAHWLPDVPYLHRQNGRNTLWLADLHQWATPPAGLPTVAVIHDPADYPKATARKASLTLAGHLHGGQAVLAERQGRLFPAAWFYRWNFLRHDAAGSTLIVSRGCADTVPLRWNCPREVVLIDLLRA